MERKMLLGIKERAEAHSKPENIALHSIEK